MGLQLPKRARRVGLLTMASAGMLLLGACTAEEKTSLKRLAQPVGATDRTGGIHSLWIGSWIAAMAVGVLVWGLIIYACIKYRRRSDDEIPVQTRYNLPIEILYTVAPVIMVLVFFYHTVTEQDAVLKPVAHPAHNIDVVGQQWSWTFNYYKDKDLPGNAAKPVSQKITVWDAGTTAYRPTLTLPVNQSVTIHLSSPDVIHSFWVPAFLFKMDVIPGRHNHFSFTPTREGWFKGRCAELCGTYHSRMLFNVHIVSASKYSQYLHGLQAKGNTGLALGGSNARTQAGLEQAKKEAVK